MYNTVHNLKSRVLTQLFSQSLGRQERIVNPWNLENEYSPVKDTFNGNLIVDTEKMGFLIKLISSEFAGEMK